MNEPTRDTLSAGVNGVRIRPGVMIAIMVYVGYLAVFLGAWAINGVDYAKIGETLESTKLHYAYPTLAGSLFLAVAVSVLGWWRPVFFDNQRSGPSWAWILPLTMLGLSAFSFINMNVDKATASLVLQSIDDSGSDHRPYIVQLEPVG